MAQRQFLMSGNDKDTVTIHRVAEYFADLREDVYALEEFAFLDDSNVKCKPRVIYDRKYWFEIEFITRGPPSHKYEISLYFFDYLNELRYIGVHYVGAIEQTRKVKIDCGDAFELTKDADAFIHVINDHVKLCSKISRKDIPFILQHEPVLLSSSQVTDCFLLFENNALSNFKIIVQTKEFHVHKEILAAKSQVFLAMFDIEMKEKKENCLIIEDIEPAVFHELLRYIYTNVVNDLKKNAENLFVAADKYNLEKLKQLCADELIRSLNVENACSYTLL